LQKGAKAPPDLKAPDESVRFQSEKYLVMKNITSISCIIFIGFIASSCSDNESEQTSQIPDKQIQAIANTPKVMTGIVVLNAEAKTTQDGRILINGTTNLPNLTNLLISIENKALDFGAQDKVNVSNGHFSAGPLGPTTGLTDGHYTIEVLMPLPSTQPETVQAIIGKQGQHLTGQLVKDTEWGGKIVEKSISYSIGSSESIGKAESEHQNFVVSIKQETIKLLTLGKEMEGVRNTRDLNKLRSCGEQMRENQSKAKSLRQLSDKLPLKYIKLKAAVMDVSSCVSCSTSALKACERVTESLKENEI